MKKALIIVDVQNDFLPSGALAVPGGSQIIAGINAAMASYEVVAATQDWHPLDHASFAKNHPGKNVFEMIELCGMPQCLWPVHCVQGTSGAELSPGLLLERISHVSRKGMNRDVDSYSGFYDNGRRGATDLHAWLVSRGIGVLHICGLATDYCVKATALDAVSLGYETVLLENLCRGVDLVPGDVARAVGEMAAAGVRIRA